MNEPTYPCEKCGKPRTKAEGGTVFTVCDECWPLTAYELGEIEGDPALNQQAIVGACKTIGRLKAQIEALKAERDEASARTDMWRERCDLIRSQYLVMSDACRALNKGIHRLRKGRDNAIKRANEYRDKLCRYEAEHPQQSMSRQFLLTEVARLEAELAEMREWTGVRYRVNTMCRQGHEMVLYVSEDWAHKCPVCEARAIKARQGE